MKRAATRDRRATVLRDDGLDGLHRPRAAAVETRALLFVDPSYELRDEHRDVVDALVKAHKRFATGVVAIWYPVIERRWVERYERALRATGIAAFATYELCVARERRGGGLVGQRHVRRQPAVAARRGARSRLPWLAERLGVDDGASYQSRGVRCHATAAAAL